MYNTKCKLEGELVVIVESFEKNYGEAEVCSFCGEGKATGVWMGHEKTIFCCKQCATQYLPQLMADAIVGGISEAELKGEEKPPVEIKQENTILQRFHAAFSTALILKTRHFK